jgi:hypothetical protein
VVGITTCLWSLRNRFLGAILLPRHIAFPSSNYILIFFNVRTGTAGKTSCVQNRVKQDEVGPRRETGDGGYIMKMF